MAENRFTADNRFSSSNRLTGGGGSSRRSLASLIGEEAATLQRTSESIARLQTQAEALGARDTTGQGPRGFLTGALDYLTRGQSGTLGFLTGLAGMEQAGETQGALQRALAGFTGKERFTGGDVVGKAAPGASILERTARGLTGFGIDVATDPLNLLTLGRGGALRGIGAGAAAEAQVARSARKVLEPVQTPEVPITTPVTASSASARASETALTRAGDIRTSDQPVVRLGAARTTATEAPVIPGPAQTFPERRAAGSTEIARVEPIAPVRVETNDEFVERLAKAAGEGQVIAAGRGSRDAMIKVARERFTGANEAEEVVDRILKGTTGEVRGGIGLRVPFLGRDVNGQITTAGEAATRRVADLTPGAGRLVDELGLRGVADDARAVFNDYRSSNFFRRYSKIFNGRFGAEYADFIRNAHKGEGAMDYTTFSKLIANDSKRTAALAVRDKAASSVIQAASRMVEKAAEPEKVKAAAERYYQMGDNMVLDAAADEADKLGYEVAAALREHGQNMFETVKEAATAAGVEIGDIEKIARNYIPRPITKAEAAFRAKFGKRTGQYSAAKSRRIGYDTDQYGRLDTASNTELNARFREMKNPDGTPVRKHDVFETDPFKVAAQQYASYSEFMSKMDLIADLKATGLLTEAVATGVRLVNLPTLARRGEKFGSALTNVADRLTAALTTAAANGDVAQVDRINAALTKIASDKTTINSLLANIQDTNPESLRVIGNLTKVLKSALAAGETAGVALTKAEKARLLSANGLVTTRARLGNVEETIGAGLKPIGFSQDVRIPRGLDNLYADETVKDAVERYFKVETGGFRDTAFFNEVYQPYYTLFKTWATVGRPGGYHLRNLQGAWWNNYLGDVSGADHKLSASVLNETRKSNDAAQIAIDNIRAGRASGLAGDEDAIARDIVALGRSRGSDVVEYEQAQLANYILAKRLEAIKVGDTTMADVLSAAREQGVLRDNRQLEYLRNEARAEGTELADALSSPEYRNLFRGVPKDELTKRQRILNRAVNNPYISVSGDLAELSENYVRLAAFISGARRYGVADNGVAAGYLTKALQFDYADLSDAERNVIKNIIPFYTWTRRNVPLQFSALLNNPGKFNKLDFAKEELQTQFGAEGDNEGMQDIIPEWMREKMGFVSMFKTPGGPISVGIESPAMDLNRYLAFGNPLSLRVAGRVKNEIVSASNPLAKALIENVTKTDTFTGAKFSENGVASPFGPDRVIRGITFTGPDGEQRVDAYGYGQIKDLLPPIGLIARLGSPGDADRRLTNWLSSIAGAPVSTLTTPQVTAELKTREDRIRKQVDRLANQYGLDKDWLRAVTETSTSAEIRSYIAAGLGKATRPEM